MNFDDKFDFCLIVNQNSVHGRGIIFITARGLDYIDETIVSSDSYRKIKTVLENLNFIEIEYCSFESKDSIFDLENELITKLEDRGLKYSKSLEIKINKEIIGLAEKVSAPQNMFPNIFSTDYLDSDINSNSTFIIPEPGEKITLYFYLFLECHFINESDCVLILNADTQTKENNYYKNFIRITKADFIRMSSDVPGAVIFQSIKKHKDFIKDISILHRGKFKFTQPMVTEIGQQGYKTKEYSYNFVEIKKSINPENHIMIQVGSNNHYSHIIERSKSIKKELAYIENKKISIDIIKSDIEQIKSNLEVKMINSADLDEYERANYFKVNISLLNDKLHLINSIEEESLSLNEYMKIFAIS